MLQDLAQDWELERRVIAEHEQWFAAGIASDGSRRAARMFSGRSVYSKTAEVASAYAAML